MNKTLRQALAMAWMIGVVNVAQATPIALLSDNFDLENGGAGAAEYSRFTNFTAANIDLLAPGYFSKLCQDAGGGTPCVDMEGSGNGSLTTKTAFDLAANSLFIAQFDLAGDQRGRSGNQVTAELVSISGEMLYHEVFALASGAGFTTFIRSIYIPDAGQVRFKFFSGGPADSMGMLLDNVVLSADSLTAVPVPVRLGDGGARLTPPLSPWLSTYRRMTGHVWAAG